MTRMRGSPSGTTFEHDPVTEDVECYQELIGDTVGARAAVLEVGSGTCRVAAALALAGHAITGVEPSAAMRARATVRLAALPERVGRRVRQVAGTAATPGLSPDERFDVILFGCNTFAHLLTAAERSVALTTLRSHLRRPGLLILDLDLAGPRRMAETMGLLWLSGTWPIPGRAAETLAHMATASPGQEREVLTIMHLFDVWAEGGPPRRTSVTLSLAQLDPAEVERSLLTAGYQVAGRLGDYDLAPWDEEAPRAILLAEAVDAPVRS